MVDSDDERDGESQTARLEWVICGRFIGYASGWDQLDTLTMQLYDFEPVEGCLIAPGDVCIYFDNGMVEVVDDSGDVTFSMDLLEAIKDCQVKRLNQ